MALKRIEMPSPNQSSRQGANVRLLVLHTAEGALTIESLGNFFSSSSAQASSHVGADDKVNTVGQYVHRNNKAWTQAAFNPVAVSMELCAFSSWDLNEWHRHPNMLANCAAWIAEECAHYGIPIEALTPNEAQGGGRGVCQHKDLGTEGGGHHDCGPDFPMQEVLTMARGGSPAPPTPEDYMAIAAAQNKAGVLHVFVEAKDGDIFYTYQPQGGNAWNGGEAGKRIAGLTFFAPAPK